MPETVHHLRFPAMGTTAHVVLVGGTVDRLESARRRIEQLEARWSRFRPDSEVSALNDADGRPVVVSDDTALLVERCRSAWRASGGRFDPTVRDAVVAAGYDDAFVAAADRTARARALHPSHPRRVRPPSDPALRPPPGLHDVSVSRPTGLVWLPAGVHLDPGAIGKGLAADIVVEELRAAGVAGACVNLGGDLRVDGDAPDGDAWSIRIDDPRDRSRELTRIPLRHGGVATSGRLGRRWTGPDGLAAHHVIDPVTGRPARTEVVAVTAVAATAWRAEVAATTAFLGGPDDTPALAHAEVLLVTEDGQVSRTARLQDATAA